MSNSFTHDSRRRLSALILSLALATSWVSAINIPVPTLTRAMIAAGEDHTLALTEDGRVWAWGSNNSGQLGDGTSSASRNSPAPVSVVPGMAKIKKIGAGHDLSIALDDNGQLWGWGSNAGCQIMNDQASMFISPVRITLPAPVVHFACGNNRAFALDSAGKLWAWGDNTGGRLGVGHANPVQGFAEITKPPTMGSITALASCDGASYAIGSSGKVWSWGVNTEGQLGDGTFETRMSPVEVNTATGLPSVKTISAGGEHVVVRCDNGSIWAWGSNSSGQLTITTTPPTVARSSPFQVIPSMTFDSAVGAGGAHSLAVVSLGTLSTWGANNAGQLGINSLVGSSIPVQPANELDSANEGNIATFVRVVGGDAFSCSFKSDGSIWTWGRNDSGQLGLGDNAQRLIPCSITALNLFNDDRDTDGLPDSWEKYYFPDGPISNQNGSTTYLQNGFTNLVAFSNGQNPTTGDNNDSDGDGVSNINEIRNQTNPNNSSDTPEEVNVWILSKKELSYYARYLDADNDGNAHAGRDLSKETEAIPVSQFYENSNNRTYPTKVQFETEVENISYFALPQDYFLDIHEPYWGEEIRTVAWWSEYKPFETFYWQSSMYEMGSKGRLVSNFITKSDRYFSYIALITAKSYNTDFEPHFDAFPGYFNFSLTSKSYIETLMSVTIPAGKTISDVPTINGQPIQEFKIAESLKVGSMPGRKVTMHLLPVEFKKMWETPNKANQVLNKTKKDDDTGNTSVLEHDGDASYAVPRNKLYVVADSADNKIKVSLDVGLPESLRTKFFAAAYDGATKVQNSDKAFPAAADQPAALEFPITGNTAKEYEIKIGYDKNSNNLLDSDESIQLEVYKHKPDNAARYLIVKGISSEKYAAHKQTIEQKITLYGTQSQPSLVAKYARSFLSIFYYKADFSHIGASVAPTTTTTISLNAFANGQGFSEWLTHNSGAAFSDEGIADIKNYAWAETSEVSEFFALRTPFALESTMSNSQGYFELPTPTGTALKAFYDAHVKTGTEAALQNSAVGTTVTFPQNGGWYDFPRPENPSLFKSTSPETSADWVTPATLVVGKNDGYSGFGALFTDIVAGTEEFKDFDAFGVVGRGRVINPRYRITVKKEQTGIWPFQSTAYNVSSILFECAVEDLYDFNYEDGELPSHAAAMQIGYGKGSGGTARDRGLIYRHRIQIRHPYSYPFDQIVAPNF